MPAADVGITAVYDANVYNISINPVTGITINAPASASYASHVNLSQTVSPGYMFSSWVVTDENGNAVTVTNNSFVMPHYNVTVSATVDKIVYIKFDLWKID